VGFHELLWDSMRFHGIPWSSMRFYNVPVNQSVPTEANRGLTSYSSSPLFILIPLHMRSVTRIHLSSQLSMLMLRGLGDRSMLHFLLSSLLCVGLDGARWALSLISCACAVPSFWMSCIEDVGIVEATSVQISPSALSFSFHSLYTHSHSLRRIHCSWMMSPVESPCGSKGRSGFG
jgi:hypothetical protein